MDKELMKEIIGKRKVDETTWLKFSKTYGEQLEFEERIKKVNENIIKYAEMREDLWEYDKQNLLDFCWQCVLDEQETDIEIILNKFRDFNGKNKIVKEKKSKIYTYIKKKTNELAESYDTFCWKELSSNENDMSDKNRIEEKHLEVINLDKIKVKNTGLKIGKENVKKNDKMTIWDYFSVGFAIIICIISLCLVIWFFILGIKVLFEPSSWEINLSNPANARRLWRIIVGIIAIILFICKR